MVVETVWMGRSHLIPVKDTRIARVVTKDTGFLADRVRYGLFCFLQQDLQRLVGTQIPAWIVEQLNLSALRWQRTRAPDELHHVNPIDNVPRLFVAAPKSDIDIVVGPRPIKLADVVATITIPDPSAAKKRLVITTIDKHLHTRKVTYDTSKRRWSSRRWSSLT